MTIETKARKFGNSVGIIIPNEALECMNLRVGETIYLTQSDDGGYRLTPYDPDFENQFRAAESIMGRYRNALRELAK